MKTLNKKQLFAVILSMTFLAGATFGQNNGANKNKTLKRRVLLLDFVNAGKNKQADYLAITIPEVILNTEQSILLI